MVASAPLRLETFTILPYPFFCMSGMKRWQRRKGPQAFVFIAARSVSRSDSEGRAIPSEETPRCSRGCPAAETLFPHYRGGFDARGSAASSG